MIVYERLTFESFQRKMKVFGISYKDKTHLEGYPVVRFEDDKPATLNPVYCWCEDTLGDNWIWSNSPHDDCAEIYFKNSNDAVMCKLLFAST